MSARRFARLTARLDTAIEWAAAAILGTAAGLLLCIAIEYLTRPGVLA